MCRRGTEAASISDKPTNPLHKAFDVSRRNAFDTKSTSGGFLGTFLGTSHLLGTLWRPFWGLSGDLSGDFTLSGDFLQTFLGTALSGDFTLLRTFWGPHTFWGLAGNLLGNSTLSGELLGTAHFLGIFRGLSRVFTGTFLGTSLTRQRLLVLLSSCSDLVRRAYPFSAHCLPHDITLVQKFFLAQYSTCARGTRNLYLPASGIASLCVLAHKQSNRCNSR